MVAALRRLGRSPPTRSLRRASARAVPPSTMSWPFGRSVGNACASWAWTAACKRAISCGAGGSWRRNSRVMRAAPSGRLSACSSSLFRTVVHCRLPPPRSITAPFRRRVLRNADSAPSVASSIPDRMRRCEIPTSCKRSSRACALGASRTDAVPTAIKRGSYFLTLRKKRSAARSVCSIASGLSEPWGPLASRARTLPSRKSSAPRRDSRACTNRTAFDPKSSSATCSAIGEPRGL